MAEIKCMNCGVELYAVNMGNRFDWICPQCNGGIVNGPNPVDNSAENVDKSEADEYFKSWIKAGLERDMYKREAGKMDEENKSLRRDNGEIKRDMDAANAEIRMLRQDNKNLRQERDEQLKAYETACSFQNDEIMNHSRRIGELGAQVHELQQENEALKNHNESLSKSRRYYKVKDSGVRAALREVREWSEYIVKELTQQCADYMAEKDKAVQELQESERLAKNAEMYKQELDALKKRYRETRNELAKLQGMRADIFVRLQTLDDRDVYIVAKTISSIIPSNNGGVKIHTTGTDHIVKNDLQDVIRLIELTIGGEEDEDY